MKNYLTFLLTFITFLTPGVAQDVYTLNHAVVNPYLYNPSLVDVEGRPTVFLLRRQQWTGVEGAPVTNYISYQSSFGKHVLFGANIVNDTRGLISSTSALLTGGYRLPIAEDQYINFAISTGVGMNNVDFNSIEYEYLENSDDPVLYNSPEKSTYLNGNAGLSYTNLNFYFGISLPQIFENKIISANSFELGDFSPFNRVIVQSSILLTSLNEKIGVQPSVAYHYSKYLPNYFEAALIGHFYRSFSAGVAYRHNSSISGILGIAIKDQVRIGYAYEINTSFNNETIAISNSTHEFSVGISFGKRKQPIPKRTKVRSNFSGTSNHSKTKETTNETSGQDAFKYVAPSVSSFDNKNGNQYSAQDSSKLGFTSSAFDVVNTATKSKPKAVKSRNVKNYLKAKKSYSNSNTSSTSGINEVYVETPKTTSELIISPTSSEEEDDQKPRFDYRKNEIFDASGNYVGPKQIQKGNHLLELNTGYYVVVGVFEEYRGAEAYSDKLFDQGFYTKYGYATQTDIYFVYTFHSPDIQTATKESNRLKTHSTIFKKVWVLTIE